MPIRCSGPPTPSSATEDVVDPNPPGPVTSIATARVNFMFRHFLTPAFAIIFLDLVSGAPMTAIAAPLITTEEAALPPHKGAVPNSGRGITRGPKIQVSEEGPRPSPMRFQVKFQTFGGSKHRSRRIEGHLSQVAGRGSDRAHQAVRASHRNRHAGCAVAARRTSGAGRHQGFRGQDGEHQFPVEDSALASMPCPFCKMELPDLALVCAACGRDTAIPESLLAERAELLAET